MVQGYPTENLESRQGVKDVKTNFVANLDVCQVFSSRCTWTVLSY